MPKGIPSLLQPRGVYRCHFCEKTYKQHAALRRHYQTKHDYHIWKVSVIFFLFCCREIFQTCYVLFAWKWKNIRESIGFFKRVVKKIMKWNWFHEKNWINSKSILYLLRFCVRFHLLSWFIDMNMWIEKMMEYCGMRKNFYLLQYSYYISAFWSDILLSKNLIWRTLILKAVQM